MAEPAPTRRSSRASATPSAATAETARASHRETVASAERSTAVWGRAEDLKGTDAVASTFVETPAHATPSTAPLSRRARRAQLASRPEPIEALEPAFRSATDDTAEPAGAASGDVSAAKDAASVVDEFEVAARLFSFTGETPVQAPATHDAAAAEPVAQASPAHVVARRSKANRGASFRRIATASFSVGVFGIVGLMAVGMTTPAQAVAVGGSDASFSAVAEGTSTTLDADELQAYVAPSTLHTETLDRTETYGTVTMAELASEAGIRNFSNLFTNDPNSNIQWPFSVGVTMSYGFGMRDGTMHEGIDFTPGEGSPVQAIADGTVRIATESGGAYGVTVLIDHVVDGQLVSSRYAHMLYGSLKVVQGQKVTVGTVIGNTGDTGRSFGAHTHFEILQNGTTAIDPWPWLQEYTDGTHTVG